MLIDTARDIVARNEQTKADDRAAAAAAYHELLGRVDAPSPGDAEKLVAILAPLGLALSDFEADANAIRELARLESEMPTEAALSEGRAKVIETSATVQRVRDVELPKLVERAIEAEAIDNATRAQRRGVLARIAAVRRDHPRIAPPPAAPATDPSPAPEQAPVARFGTMPAKQSS